MIKNIIISLLLLINIYSLAIIIESNDIAAICQHIQPDKKVLILFDVDNTIARTLSSLGSDEWNTHMIQQGVNAGKEYRQAVEAHLPLYFQLMHALDLKPVDPMTPDFIIQLQSMNHHVCALTLRSLPLVERTAVQLNTIGIRFADSCPFTQQKYHDNCQCHEGIIFTGGGDKGVALSTIFTYHDHLTYDLVIFVDDKRRYLEQVEVILAQLGIQFVGIRYSYADDIVAQFDPEVTARLLQEWQNQTICQ